MSESRLSRCPPPLGALRRVRQGALLVAAAVLVASPALAQVKSDSKRTENKDGSTSLDFSNEVSALGTKVGLAVTEPAASSVADPVAGQEALSGSAYAKVAVKTLPDWVFWQKGAVDVTLNPADETSKVATSFSRSVGVVGGVTATLKDSYSFERAATSEAWETDKSVSVKLEDTGTTLAVGAKTGQDQAGWLPSISAEQEIAKGFNVTTSVADTGSEIDKSVKAGFKHRW